MIPSQVLEKQRAQRQAGGVGGADSVLRVDGSVPEGGSEVWASAHLPELTNFVLGLGHGPRML